MFLEKECNLGILPPGRHSPKPAVTCFSVQSIQNELGKQILADFEEALSVRGVKVYHTQLEKNFRVNVV